MTDAARQPQARQGTWHWLVSSCFGKDNSSHADDASGRRRRRGLSGASSSTNNGGNYGGIGYDSAPNINTSLDGTTGASSSVAGSNVKKSGGVGKLSSKGSSDPWVAAMNALLAEVDAGAEAKVPSFNWRMRSNYGTGATSVGPEGARRLCDALVVKGRERRERIAALTVRLSTSSSDERAGCAAELSALEARSAHAVRHIDLRAQNIGDAGAEAIGDLLASDDLVEVIVLSRNGIGPAGAAALAHGLSQNPASLKKLVIGEGNVIDSRAAVALCRAILSQQQRERENGRRSRDYRRGGHTFSYDAGSTPLQSSLRNTNNNGGSNVTTNNRVASGGASTAAVASSSAADEFAGTAAGIADLEVSFGPTTSLDDDAGMAIRDACLGAAATLRSLKIVSSPQAFTAASLGAVLRGMAQNTSLASLSLHGCVDAASLTNNPNGPRALLEPFATAALCGRPSMGVGMGMGSPMAMALNAGVGGVGGGIGGSESPLRLVDLTGVLIGCVGAKVLSDALKARTAAPVRTLVLAKCGIGAMGFEAIGAMAEQNPHLTRLDLSGNLSNNAAFSTDDTNGHAAAGHSQQQQQGKKGDQARGLIMALCGVAPTVSSSSQLSSSLAHRRSPSTSGGGGGGLSANGGPSGLQELLITDYHVASDAVDVLIDALSRPSLTPPPPHSPHSGNNRLGGLPAGGGGGVPLSNHSSHNASLSHYGHQQHQLAAGPTTTAGRQLQPLRLRTLRYGSCDASDAAQTRLHNLITANSEAFMAREAAVASAALASPEGREGRRAVVSFTSGGGGGGASSGTYHQQQGGGYPSDHIPSSNNYSSSIADGRVHRSASNASSSVPPTPYTPGGINVSAFAANNASFVSSDAGAEGGGVNAANGGGPKRSHVRQTSSASSQHGGTQRPPRAPPSAVPRPQTVGGAVAEGVDNENYVAEVSDDVADGADVYSPRGATAEGADDSRAAITAPTPLRPTHADNAADNPASPQPHHSHSHSQHAGDNDSNHCLIYGAATPAAGVSAFVPSSGERSNHHHQQEKKEEEGHHQRDTCTEVTPANFDHQHHHRGEGVAGSSAHIDDDGDVPRSQPAEAAADVVEQNPEAPNGDGADAVAVALTDLMSPAPQRAEQRMAAAETVAADDGVVDIDGIDLDF